MQKQVRLATNLGRGGISALILQGTLQDLEAVDFSLENIQKRGFSLHNGELSYGILKDKNTGNILDEVVMTAYNENCRIITGHGGSASALALLAFFIQLGFNEVTNDKFTLGEIEEDTLYLKSLLSQTKTEYQALSCLRAINSLKEDKSVDIASVTDLMRPRIVVLAGSPNVGKSSLLNILCGYERVLVSNIAGTTRDAVRDYIDIGGYYTHLIDTAGFRSDVGESEEEAINRGKTILATADVILLILDNSREFNESDMLAIDAVKSFDNAHIIPVLNKTDIANTVNLDKSLNLEDPIAISCIEEKGISDLLQRITDSLNEPTI